MDLAACTLTDGTFGPWAQKCRGGLDFTVLFEEAILGILPSCLFTILALLRIVQLRRSKLERGKANVQSNRILAGKQAAIVVMVLIRFTALLVWKLQQRGPKTKLTDSYLFFSFLELACLAALSYHEHTFSLAPSTLIGFYLFLTLVFDCVRVRTLWLLQTHILLAVVYSSCLLVKLCLIVLESCQKRLSETKTVKMSEGLSGFYGRALFLWVLVILRDGHRRVLTLSDTFDANDQRFSESLRQGFREKWSAQTAQESEKSFALLCILAKSTSQQVLSPVVPRLAMIAVSIAQPLLIERLLLFVDTPTQNPSMHVGYALIGAFACLYGATAVVNAWYAHTVNRLGLELRSQLIDAIYRKSLNLPIGVIDGGSITTLINVDVQRIMDGAQVLHEPWASTTTVGISMYILYRQLSYAFIAPFVFIIGFVILTGMCVNVMVGRQAAWLEATEKRIGSTLRAISSIKEIKMLGLATPFFQNLRYLRGVEILSAKKFRRFLSLVIVTSAASSQVAILAAYGLYAIISKAKGSAPLNTTTLFTSLAILEVATNPLLTLVQGIPRLASTVACIARIQTFLRLPECMGSTVSCDTASQSSLFNGGSDEGFDSTELSPVMPRQEHSETVAARQRLCIAKVKQAAFSWTSSDSLGILRDISFEIHRSELIAIIGMNGSGKSTLLHSLLGETYTRKGSTYFTGTTRIAFCHQTPWLLNDSIRTNILLGNPYIETWYEKVLDACSLCQDLSTFRGGDSMFVGPQGALLSGGQKQRIALARALYSRPDLLLLDDVFSGLDRTTEKHILSALLGPNGLITCLGSGVILVSHSVRWLPHANKILVLHNGQIVEHGSFQELQSAGGYIQDLEVQDEEQKFNDLEIANAIPLADYTGLNQAASEGFEAQPASLQSGEFSVYWYYIKALGLRFSFVFFILAAITAAERSYGNVWLSNWAASGRTEKTSFYISIFTALVVGGLISLYSLCFLYFDFLLSRASLHLYNRQLDALMRAPISFSTATDSDIVSNRFIQDIMLIDDEIPMAFINTTTSFFAVIGETVIILFSSKYLSAALPLLIGALYAVQRFYLKTSRQLRLMDISAQAPLSAHIAETVQGVTTIRAFGRVQKFVETNRAILETSQSAMYSLLSVQVWLKLVLDWTVAGLAVLVVGIAVGLRSSQSLGFLGLALLNLISLSSSFKYLITFWVTLETAIGAVTRIRMFINDTEPEETTNLPTPLQGWPIYGRIEFSHVTASYRSATKPVLKDISFSIENHENIGICGRSGSGKSSLLATILHVLEIDNGNVKIDDINITSCAREALRSRFTFLPQDPLFFPGSIRHNLETWTAVSDQRIEQALRKVDLWQLVIELGGLDTELDYEAMLSGGQRQLFCLARALLKDSPIVLLDEATSNIDHASDEVIQKVIRTELKNKTVIAVVHRLDTILDFDKILVMSEGRLVEYGNPEVLLQQQDSAFFELWNSK